jgi:hypothetical protein
MHAVHHCLWCQYFGWYWTPQLPRTFFRDFEKGTHSLLKNHRVNYQNQLQWCYVLHVGSMGEVMSHFERRVDRDLRQERDYSAKYHSRCSEDTCMGNFTLELELGRSKVAWPWFGF